MPKHKFSIWNEFAIKPEYLTADRLPVCVFCLSELCPNGVPAEYFVAVQQDGVLECGIIGCGALCRSSVELSFLVATKLRGKHE